MTEKWEWVVGWESLYLVSSFGRVMSCPRVGQTSFGERIYGGGPVTPVKKSNGYLAVNLTDMSGKRKQLSIHCLVLEAFVGPRPQGMQCCHWDGVRFNNRLDNLRWDTVANNHQDKKRHGTYWRKEAHVQSA